MIYKNFFDDLNMFGVKMGMNRVKLLFELLDAPHKKIKFIHVAGTNGKGSVAAFTAALLSSHGLKTGLYTSPHLISVRERFRINGKAISHEKLDEYCGKLKNAMQKLEELSEGPPSYFEVTTALAALYFAENSIDFAVWETGMGGRLDATNIVTPEISIITSIGIDHVNFLGDSEQAIAFEKAGIIKPHKTVVCGELNPVSEKIIKLKAEKLNAEIYFPLKEKKLNSLTFLEKNKMLAEKTVKLLVDKSLVSKTICPANSSNLLWPGRFQSFNDNFIIDGAHNPEGAKALILALNLNYPDTKFKIIFASFAEKDFIQTIRILSSVASEFIFTIAGKEKKTAPPEKIAKAFSELNLHLPYSVDANPKNALNQTNFQNVLVTGSLYLVGEVLKILDKTQSVLNIY